MKKKIMTIFEKWFDYLLIFIAIALFIYGLGKLLVDVIDLIISTPIYIHNKMPYSKAYKIKKNEKMELKLKYNENKEKIKLLEKHNIIK